MKWHEAWSEILSRRPGRRRPMDGAVAILHNDGRKLKIMTDSADYEIALSRQQRLQWIHALNIGLADERVE